jgi:hypothetical protein
MHTQVAAGNQTIDLELPDDWDATKVGNAKTLIRDALLQGNAILQYVEEYLFDKLVPRAARPAKLKALLDFYFGLKPETDDLMYAHVMNQIVAGLQLAKKGLLEPVIHIVDVRQTSGLAGLQLQCMGTINSSLFDQLGGFVFSPLTESIPKALGDWWRGSSGVGNVEFRPKAGTIHLNIGMMLQKLGEHPLIAAHTLIHEATHKFAHTADHKYFDAGSDRIMPRIDDKVRSRSADDPETVVAESWTALASGSYKEDMMERHAQAPTYWAANADSLAHLAVDIYTWKLNHRTVLRAKGG